MHVKFNASWPDMITSGAILYGSLTQTLPGLEREASAEVCEQHELLICNISLICIDASAELLTVYPEAKLRVQCSFMSEIWPNFVDLVWWCQQQTDSESLASNDGARM